MRSAQPSPNPGVDQPFAVDWRGRAPYRNLHPNLVASLEQRVSWPAPEEYDELAGQVPQALDAQLPRFVHQDRTAVTKAGGYEAHVATLRAVPTRARSWHDLFNMVVWAHFPKLRWALNGLHVEADPGAQDPRNGRSPAQNLAASFDEAGLLVVSTSADVLSDLRELRFKRALWERREELSATTRFWLVGHGTLETLLAPHPGIVARALQLHVPRLPCAEGEEAFRFEVDALAAARIRSWRASRAVLDPVPVLGIPGYFSNDTCEFYDDPDHFRFDGRSRRPVG